MTWLCVSRLGICALGLFLSGAAWAAQDTRVQEHQRAMQAYAQKTGQAAPVVVEYEYGQKLDIARMIGMTESIRSCEPVPMAMTYEDHFGTLNTVLYSAMGTCPKG